MAKKVAGKGMKTCPQCSEVIGARSSECPKCGHKFTPKAAKKAKGSTDPMAVIAKVKEFGGKGEVQKALNSIAALQAKVDEAAQNLKALGGVEGAEEALKLLGDLEAALKAK